MNLKRPSYVDSQGNKVDPNESLKLKMNIGLFIGTILPIILVIIICYVAIHNIYCNKTYTQIKNVTKEYLMSKHKLPSFEGESETVNVLDLYEKRYLRASETGNYEISGKVKVTRHKGDYIYTLNLTNCKSCTTSKKYGGWSSEKNYYPTGKAIVDVIPYYNYVERRLGVTDWSRYFDEEELSDTIDPKYKIPIPEKDELPSVPNDVEIIGLQTEYQTLYKYQDKLWKWYDINGDYSDFYSEQPNGYDSKDKNTEKYSEWSDFSYNRPEEKEYRTVEKRTAYKYYNIDEKGQKNYYNNGQYAVEVDKTKYPKMEDDSTIMFRYRDKVWRWYNGNQRSYSKASATPIGSKYIYKDEELYTLGNESNWSEKSSLNENNLNYRVETSKQQVRYAVQYIVTSLPIYKSPISRDDFIKKIGMGIPKFAKGSDVKVEVTYKYKYRKS